MSLIIKPWVPVLPGILVEEQAEAASAGAGIRTPPLMSVGAQAGLGAPLMGPYPETGLGIRRKLQRCI